MEYENQQDIFFKALWGEEPPEGYLILSVLTAKKAIYNYSFNTKEIFKAINEVKKLTSMGNLYHTLGLQLKELPGNERGDENNVCAIPGLWLDIDIGKYKHSKKDLPPTEEDAMALINKFPLKPSIIIHSGGGYHVYWLFKEPWLIETNDERQIAKNLSIQFNQTFMHYGKEHGWNIDKTSDLCRMLRIPGTQNIKQGYPVYILEHNENRYNPTDFEEYLIEYLVEDTVHDKSGSDSGDVTENPRKNNILNELIEQCAFLKHCRDNAVSLSEPEWHKMIDLLAHEYGAHDLIHQLSKPYPKYNKAETDEYINKVIKNSPGPIKCETLKTIWDCQTSCGVTSPIHLKNKIIKDLKADTEVSDQTDNAIEFDILKERIKDYSFPWDCLPARLTECMKDLGDDIGVQPEMCATIALSIISTAIGNSVEYIEAKKGYKTTLNLWVIIMANSGAKKTPVLNRLMEPIYLIQSNEFKNHLIPTTQPQPNNSLKRPKSVYTTDPTIEALLELLDQNSRGILLFQDEISGLLRSFDKYRNGKGGDREQYLNLWNSKPVKIDRVSKQLYVEKPNLTILGGMQPSKAVSIFKEESFDDGLISRFLYFNKDNDHKELTNHVWSTDNQTLWTELIKTIYSISDKINLSLTDEAWEVFREYVNHLDKIGLHLPAKFQIFIPKAHVYILRLTGLLHIAEFAINHEEIPTSVTKETVEKAVKLMKYFLCQSRKIFELYGPKRREVTLDQKYILKAINELYLQRKSFNLPTSEIMVSYNQLVPEGAKIKSDRSFGKFLLKELDNLNIAYIKKKVNVGNNKTLQCLVITDDTLKKIDKVIDS